MLFVKPANAYFKHKSKFPLLDTEIRKYELLLFISCPKLDAAYFLTVNGEIIRETGTKTRNEKFCP